MNKITQSLTLDLVEIRHNIINARQGDQLVRDLTITITNNGNTYSIPEDADVRLRGARPDGKYVLYDCTDSLDEECAVTDRKNGIVHIDIPDYLLSSSGRAYLDIGIYQDVDGQKTEVASTEKFVLYIPEKIFSEEDVVNSPEGNTLNELIQTTKELNNIVSQNESERQEGYTNMGNQISDIASTINENKIIWDDKYTKNEVDNKFSALETNIDWKESVETYADISETYPNPQDGWTVNVKDTDYTYRYNGTEWVVISANAIPKATSVVDGLLSKEDKINYDDANTKKHQHSNKEILDGITVDQITKWNNNVDALPITGGTLTGDLRIKGSGNYGTKINLGDGDYVHFSEPTDDCLEIKAKKINFLLSNSSPGNITVNDNGLMSSTSLGIQSFRTDGSTIYEQGLYNIRSVYAGDGTTRFDLVCSNGNTTDDIKYSVGCDCAKFILDVKDGRKTYMNYSSACVTDFTYFAVWNPNQPGTGNVELRAYNKADVANAIGALPKSGGTMTGKITTAASLCPDSYSGGALELRNSNITGVNGIYTSDVADVPAEGINFYRTATTVDSLHANNGTLYFTPNRTIGTNGTSKIVQAREYGTINSVHGNKNGASYVYKDTDGHGHLHLYLTGVSFSSSNTWTTVASSSIKPPAANRAHIIIADGAYTMSGTERTGCTFNTAGEVSVISPVTFTNKNVFIDVFW